MSLPASISAELDGLVGQTLAGRYQLHGLVDAGSMGRVYRATDPYGRVVAVKIVRPRRGSRTATLLERFRLEAESLVALAHPHIVTVFDSGRTPDGDPFLAMEYLEGESLDRWIAREGRLPLQRVIQTAAQMCRALRKAHSLGVIHRDVKPSNVIVRFEDDDDVFIKLVDFGIAKLYTPEARRDRTHLTAQGALLGSPLYMAPEQILGDDVDPRTDIYALGVTMFHMITGAAPFEAKNSFEVIRMHIEETVPSIRQVAPDVLCPDSLDRIVRRCMSKWPRDRYASIADLLADLRVAWTDVASVVVAEGGAPGPVRFDSEIVSAQPIPALPAAETVDVPIAPAFAEPKTGPIRARTPSRARPGIVLPGLLVLGVGLGTVLATLAPGAIDPGVTPQLSIGPAPTAEVLRPTPLERPAVRPPPAPAVRVEAGASRSSPPPSSAGAKISDARTADARAARTEAIDRSNAEARKSSVREKPPPRRRRSSARRRIKHRSPRARPAPPPEYKANPF